MDVYVDWKDDTQVLKAVSRSLNSWTRLTTKLEKSSRFQFIKLWMRSSGIHKCKNVLDCHWFNELVSSRWRRRNIIQWFCIQAYISPLLIGRSPGPINDDLYCAKPVLRSMKYELRGQSCGLLTIGLTGVKSWVLVHLPFWLGQFFDCL